VLANNYMTILVALETVMCRFLSLALLLILLPVSGMAATPTSAREIKRTLVLYSLDKANPVHILTEQLISKILLTTGRTS
jgi:hypothetical protein